MIEQSRAIVISAIKYGDNALIVKMLTDTAGIRSYLVRGVLGAKKGKFRSGHFQPLTLLEVVASHKDKGGLEYLKEVKLLQHYRTLQTDIRKSAIVMFLSELLNVALKEEEPDLSLFTFLMTWFEWLDHHEDIANFHIAFLIHLSRYLGFHPEISRADLPVFDLREGEFTENTLHESIDGVQLEKFRSFLVADIEASADIKMNKQQRGALLKSLITYYRLHLQGFREPRSLAVLNEIFN